VPVGTLYYPLETSAARSGFPFSVSAPFEMNEHRSNIVDPQNSPWNAWLLDEAARFAVRILPEQLHQHHGADAYSAFASRTTDSKVASGLTDEIDRLLRGAPSGLHVRVITSARFERTYLTGEQVDVLSVNSPVSIAAPPAGQVIGQGQAAEYDGFVLFGHTKPCPALTRGRRAPIGG
jgi:hypothetical protein